MIIVKIGTVYKVKFTYYDEIYQVYTDRFGREYRARGPIEIYGYTANDTFDIPEDKGSDIYLEEDQTALVIDLIDSEKYNYSHVMAKKIVKSFTRDVIFLWNQKTYSMNNDLFLKVMDECK